MLFNVATDRLPVFLEVADRSFRKVAVSMKGKEPIESRPAENPGVSIMLSPRARLPDPLIRLLPVAADVIPKRADHFASLPIQGAVGADKMRHRVDDFPVDIELQLPNGRVADPHRPR